MPLVKTNENDIAIVRFKAILLAIRMHKAARLAEILVHLSNQEIATVLNNLSAHDRKILLSNTEINAKVLHYLDPKIRKQVLNEINYKLEANHANQDLNTDEVLDKYTFQTNKFLSTHNYEGIKRIFDDLQPADAAAVLEFLTQNQRIKVIKILDYKFDPKILTFIDMTIREDLFNQLDLKSISHLIANLDYVDIITILDDLDTHKQNEILNGISKLVSREILKAIKKSLFYEEGTAGRIMTPSLSFSNKYTVKEVYNKFCFNTKLAKENHTLYIHDIQPDNKFRLIGSIYIADLCRLNKNKYFRNQCIAEHVDDVPCILKTDTKLQRIAFLFRKYFALQLPVVNPKNYKLMGVINANQAMDILDMYIGGQILNLGGLRDFDFHESIFSTILTRLKWLGVASLATLFSTFIIHFFEDSIKGNSFLGVIMPIAPAVGGNAASQVLTITIRALSNGEIGQANLLRTIKKEIISNLGSGLFIGLGIGCITFLFSKKLDFAIILALALIANITWAGLIASAMPIFLDRNGKDPTLTSVFLTITTDMMGYLIFFMLVRAILPLK